MLKCVFSCWLKVVLWEFLSISVWNHYAAKTQSSGARVLLVAANCVVSAVSNCSVRFFAGHVRYCSERADNRNWKWHPGSRFDQFLFPHFGFVSAKPNTVRWCYYWDGSVASSCVRAEPAT
jgi:hypothetical protein